VIAGLFHLWAKTVLLVHRQHDAGFWNEVGEILRDLWERERWLKVNGVELELGARPRIVISSDSEKS
jgi:hypothetical protein